MRGLALALSLTLSSIVTFVAPPCRGDTDDQVGEALEAMGAWNMAEARRAVGQVVKRSPETPVAWLLQGQLSFFEGRYDEATALLTRAAAGLSGDNGVSAHLAAMSRAVGDATRGYASHTTSGGHFTIRWQPGVDDVMIPWMDDVLEAAWGALTVQFGQVPEAPVRVELYPKADTLAAVTPLTSEEIRQSGTIALCKYNRLMITSPRDLVYGYGWADTLAHEFIHMLITQRSRNQVPIWLHEGLAKYYEVGWRNDAAPTMDIASKTLLAQALAQDSLISFEAMSPSMAKLPNQEATATAFAEVHTVIEFLRGRHGDALPRSLTTLMAEGKSDRETVATLAKLPWARFEGAWKAHLKRQGYKRRDAPFDTRLLFKGHDTEADELTLIKGEEGRRFVWLGDRLSVEARPLAASKEYRKAADAVGEPVPLIQAKLGRALLALGRVEEAISELEKTLTLYPEYMLTRLLMGEAWLRQGDPGVAREHLEEAALINPFDPQLHDHLRRVYEALGETERAARAAAAHAKLMAQAPSAAP
jgi:tetratricopeptide (TPR) repeat protein